ncbi:hypothetical protein [Culicoidibacter larvae]|uniref:Uncharacterized protein n=1 Tax=Culicoidibacter larvae TaxID=2579976 RepID=A0A5R8QCE5_9FIRM|nr:hypothetical protein [Culicoidibacter larvae]TLG72988.1 hypothetical protein FEZ08_08050 [Culicoidibacter larvae]
MAKIIFVITCILALAFILGIIIIEQQNNLRFYLYGFLVDWIFWIGVVLLIAGLLIFISSPRKRIIITVISVSLIGLGILFQPFMNAEYTVVCGDKLLVQYSAWFREPETHARYDKVFPLFYEKDERFTPQSSVYWLYCE